MKTASLIALPLIIAAIGIPQRAMAAEIQIVEAFYTSDRGKACNVTDKVKNICKDTASTGVCRIKADNSLCSPDHDPGHTKKLTLKYSCGTGIIDFVITESSTDTIICK